MMIDIGCGFKRTPNYIRIDSDPSVNPDFCLDLEVDPLPFNDNSIKKVIAHHILEHLGDGYFYCLCELYRVCESGAVIEVSVPHHRHDVFLNDPTHKRPITLDGLRLFDAELNKQWIEMGANNSTLGLKYGINFKIDDYYLVFDASYKDIIKRIEDGDKVAHDELAYDLHHKNNVAVELNMRVQVIK